MDTSGDLTTCGGCPSFVIQTLLWAHGLCSTANLFMEINMPSTSGQPAYIELYSGWATTEKGGFLYGRVHKGEALPLPQEGDGLARKLDQTIRDLDTRGLANAQVRLTGFPGAGPFTADGRDYQPVAGPCC